MSDDRKSPALLALVDERWLVQAFKDLINEKHEIYFGTHSPQIAPAVELQRQIKTVYFKITGKPQVVARADFIEVTKENPDEKLVTGSQYEQGVVYYGFREITSLSRPIPLSLLKFFETGTPVPNDQRGACIIREIG